MKCNCLLTVSTVTPNEYEGKVVSEHVTMDASYSDNAEDNSFSEATPSASFSMMLSNPALLGKLQPGDKIDVVMTKREAAIPPTEKAAEAEGAEATGADGDGNATNAGSGATGSEGAE